MTPLHQTRRSMFLVHPKQPKYEWPSVQILGWQPVPAYHINSTDSVVRLGLFCGLFDMAGTRYDMTSVTGSSLLVSQAGVGLSLSTAVALTSCDVGAWEWAGLQEDVGSVISTTASTLLVAATRGFVSPMFARHSPKWGRWSRAVWLTTRPPPSKTAISSTGSLFPSLPGCSGRRNTTSSFLDSPTLKARFPPGKGFHLLARR